MADAKFYTVITTIGEARFAEAAISGSPLSITQMAVGDGGGALPSPGPNDSELINEQYRGYLNGLVITDGAANVLTAEMIMPPQIGGFWLREVALYADDGSCIAIGNLPESYKPLLAEGSGRFQVIRVLISVSNTENVELIADPSVILVTMESVIEVKNEVKDYADEQLSEHEQSRNHPDATLTQKGFTQLSNETDSDSEELAATPAAIKAAIEEAIRGAWDLDNPIGDVRLFSQNVNPNEKWPWSTWQYLGEDRTIRLAKADGSDVGATGGSDTITISKDNLPNVQIDVSGTAESVDLGTLNTTGAGGHTHRGKSAESNTSIDGGSSNRRSWANDYGFSDEGLIEPVEDHVHQVDIPPHEHNVSGKTAALGESSSIDVTNKYIKLMAWHRTA